MWFKYYGLREVVMPKFEKFELQPGDKVTLTFEGGLGTSLMLESGEAIGFVARIQWSQR